MEIDIVIEAVKFISFSSVSWKFGAFCIALWFLNGVNNNYKGPGESSTTEWKSRWMPGYTKNFMK